ncbi:unnamed protein product [Phytomonas sp. EM1]|nr:unnamed protein product [Phytomonas sp. EM1]|eukprot:CCW62659.1 unnamed protein product [Phytomonas sp. isolate EM1]
MWKLTSDGRKKVIYYVMLFLYAAFIIAYVVGAFDFLFHYDNKWAAAGFFVVVFLIGIRFWMYYQSRYTLYARFPYGSKARICFYIVFMCLGFVGVGLGIWLMIRGLKLKQRWDGKSYFCSMIGMFMMGKWAFFLSLAMYLNHPLSIPEEEEKKSPGCV